MVDYTVKLTWTATTVRMDVTGTWWYPTPLPFTCTPDRTFATCLYRFTGSITLKLGTFDLA